MHDGLRKHKLLPKELEKRFAKVGSQDGRANDALVIAKFFNPYGMATWLATEYIPEDRCFFGFVNLIGPDCAEWGYFSLDELDELLVPVMGCKLPIERDCFWAEKPMKDAKKEIGC